MLSDDSWWSTPAEGGVRVAREDAAHFTGNTGLLGDVQHCIMCHQGARAALHQRALASAATVKAEGAPTKRSIGRMAGESRQMRVKERENDGVLATINASMLLVADGCPQGGGQLAIERRAVTVLLEGHVRNEQGQFYNNCSRTLRLEGSSPKIRYLHRTEHEPRTSAIAVTCGAELPPPLSFDGRELDCEVTLFPKQRHWSQVEQRLRDMVGGPHGAVVLEEVPSSSEAASDLNYRLALCKRIKETCYLEQSPSLSHLHTPNSSSVNSATLDTSSDTQVARNAPESQEPEATKKLSASKLDKSRIASLRHPKEKHKDAERSCSFGNASRSSVRLSWENSEQAKSTKVCISDKHEESGKGLWSQEARERAAAAAEQRRLHGTNECTNSSLSTTLHGAIPVASNEQYEPNQLNIQGSDNDDETLDVEDSEFEPFDYPCGKSTVTLGWDEWRRLQPGELLNDNVIDFFIAYVMVNPSLLLSASVYHPCAEVSRSLGFGFLFLAPTTQREAGCQREVIAESPFFFAKLPEEAKSNMDTVNADSRLHQVCHRWPNARKALSVDLFLVPTCSSMHWSLFAVYKPYDLLAQDAGDACIMHWDSKRPLHNGLESRIRTFMAKTLQLDPRGSVEQSKVAFDTEKFPIKDMPMPQQSNGTDCGYLMLFAAKRVCNSAKYPERLNIAIEYSAEEITRSTRRILAKLFKNKGTMAWRQSSLCPTKRCHNEISALR